MAEIVTRGDPATGMPQHRMQLKQGGMLRVQGGQGVDIVAIEGRLWIIQETDAQDLELDAGQSMQIVNGGVALIQALKASTLALVPARNGGLRDNPPTVNRIGTG